MYRHGPSSLKGSVWCCRFPHPGQPSSDEPEPPIRWDLVERIRREIAAGTYDTPEKWEAALQRLLDRLQQE
ncbi:MAG TPA: hypothetical protein VNK04_17930 [Gemmataceae bacterium]|nr:hypothetical protein [Gemmataceae bacterium]